jgi:hypothetical protein
MVCLAQTVHLSCTDTNTVSKRTKTRFHMTHSPRSSIGCVQDDFQAYGMFGTNGTPILCQDEHYLQMDSNELPLEPRHLEVPSGVSKTIFEPMVLSAQSVHLSCVKISTISKRNETSFHMSLVKAQVWFWKLSGTKVANVIWSSVIKLGISNMWWSLK